MISYVAPDGVLYVYLSSCRIGLICVPHVVANGLSLVRSVNSGRDIDVDAVNARAPPESLVWAVLDCITTHHVV